MTLIEWDKLIDAWANERGLGTTDFPASQVGKLTEESGELAQAHARHDIEEAKDAIGDSLVVLKILCMQSNTDFIAAFINSKCAKPVSPIMAYEALVHILALNGKFADSAGTTGRYSQWMVSEYIGALHRVIVNTPGFTFDLLDAMEYAWNQIKDRKGVLYNGQFVKTVDVMDSGNATLISLYKEKYGL